MPGGDTVTKSLLSDYERKRLISLENRQAADENRIETLEQEVRILKRHIQALERQIDRVVAEKDHLAQLGAITAAAEVARKKDTLGDVIGKPGARLVKKLWPF